MLHKNTSLITDNRFSSSSPLRTRRPDCQQCIRSIEQHKYNEAQFEFSFIIFVFVCIIHAIVKLHILRPAKTMLKNIVA